MLDGRENVDSIFAQNRAEAIPQGKTFRAKQSFITKKFNNKGEEEENNRLIAWFRKPQSPFYLFKKAQTNFLFCSRVLASGYIFGHFYGVFFGHYSLRTTLRLGNVTDNHSYSGRFSERRELVCLNVSFD